MAENEKKRSRRNRLTIGEQIGDWAEDSRIMVNARRSPLQAPDIAAALDCAHEALQECLDGMVGDGTLMRTRRKGYGTPGAVGVHCRAR